MKKLSVISAALLLLTLAQIGQAADLQAGWYVKLGGVALYGTDPGSGHEVAVDWSFAGPVGPAGPFEVAQSDPLWPQRTVSVPASTNVPDGTAVDLFGQPKTPITFAVTRLDLIYETNYVASQMLAQLFVEHTSGQSELLWQESRSGLHNRYATLLAGTGRTLAPSDTIYFRVVAVPEPSGLSVLLPAIGLLWLERRRTR